MKNTGLTLLFILSIFFAFGQAPQKMSYQAVIRNATDNLVSNTNIGMQISILQSTSTGIAVFIETHSVTTNINGLATLEIGTGTTVTGVFSNIDWSAGPYFIKSETDLTGGTTYTISGTSELMSVTYALYSENAFSGNYSDLTNAPTNVSTFTNDAGYITSPNDADSDPANEIQSLQLVGQSLTISSGNTVTLPAGSNTLDQAYDQGGSGVGRTITVDAGEVAISTATSNGIALRATNTNTGVSIIADNTSSLNTFSTIQGSTNSNSTIASAIIGNSSGVAWGVSGQVQAVGTAQAAVYGSNLRTTGGHGVYGIGLNGVVGETNYSQGNALWGENFDAIAPLGNGVGTAGIGYYGVVGQDRYNGAAAGAYGVLSNGDFGATGVKTFLIDHPEDPENKILRHFSTESNEVLNIYRGNAVFDANGEAIVQLPEYYEEINKNPSYNLTPVGAYAELYVKKEIANGTFIIGGGQMGLKVSWTIYAERNDLYLQQFPEKRDVVIEKREGQKGKYFMPYLYNQPKEKAVINPERKQELIQPKIEIKK